MILALLMMSCGFNEVPPPQADPSRSNAYLKALDAKRPEDRNLAGCRPIHGPSSEGECVLFAAKTQAQARNAPPSHFATEPPQDRGRRPVLLKSLIWLD